MFDDLQKKQDGVDDIFADTDPNDSQPKTTPEEPSSTPTPLGVSPNSSPDKIPRTEDVFGSSLASSGKGKGIIKKMFIFIFILAILGGGAYFVYSQFLMPSSYPDADIVLNQEQESGLPEEDVVSDEDDFFVDDNIVDEDDFFIDDQDFGLVDDDFLFEEERTEIEESRVMELILGSINLNDLEQYEIDDLKRRDSDGDGLSDYDEIFVHGTDPYNPDTDGDGLTDWEEVVIFGTDPLNPDTDGDSFEDGSEVLNCYNPLGAGEIDVSLFEDADLFYERFPNLIDKCEL